MSHDTLTTDPQSNPRGLRLGDVVTWANPESPQEAAERFTITGAEGRFGSKVFLAPNTKETNRVMGSRNVMLFIKVTGTNAPATPALPTRARFMEVFTEAFDRNQLRAAAPGMREKFLAGVRETLEGKFTVTIDSQSFKDAWKALGLKGRPTYKAMHAFPAA